MKKYETIFVVDSLLKSEEIDSIVNKYERIISANGGKIEDIEHWGKKRLAYEIKKRQYGYYVLIRFDGPPTMIKTLEREYRLNESLLRYKTLAIEKASIQAAEKAEEEVQEKEQAQPAASEESPAPETEDAAEEKEEEVAEEPEEEKAAAEAVEEVDEEAKKEE